MKKVNHKLSSSRCIDLIQELFETSSKMPGRGMATKSLALIDAMYKAAKDAQPITGRGIGYKLFVAGLIKSMSRQHMASVYHLLKRARERGDIPWAWIVDETRELERVSTWDDPAEYARCVTRSYRRDFGINNQGASRFGARRGRCEVCLRLYSTSMVLASG